jgi:repressor LexA
VYAHLQALVRKGFIEQTGRSRRYRPLRTPGITIAGRIQAGCPIESEEGSLGELVIDTAAFTGGGTIVALRVVGDSMIGAGIFDGDYVVVRRQPRVENGEIAAVLVNGAGTLKRVHVGRGRVVLRPDNERFEPIAPDKRDDVRVYGKLVAVLRGGLKIA